jgi:hypothetical protein
MIIRVLDVNMPKSFPTSRDENRDRSSPPEGPLRGRSSLPIYLGGKSRVASERISSLESARLLSQTETAQ